MGQKIDDLNPILSKITRPVAAIKSLRFFIMFSNSNEFFSPGMTPSSPFTARLVDLKSTMKIFGITVANLETQFWAVSNHVYKHGFHFFLCKWNTDTAPGGGGKWASPNLQVWKKLVTLIYLEANTFRPEQMTHTFQMAFPDEISPLKCFYIDSN